MPKIHFRGKIEYNILEKIDKEITKEKYLELKDVSPDQTIKFQNIEVNEKSLNISRERKNTYMSQTKCQR